jgi:hypothetical protein
MPLKIWSLQRFEIFFKKRIIKDSENVRAKNFARAKSEFAQAKIKNPREMFNLALIY